ncbi:MAG: SGNH/GDSL hydrolase family protein [Deltaproteobacteria bacterium]|nr:SGNH/GDSL hydrolase family protein [Deltaproteobacteria bacterium]MBI3390791.1 SGNH/GDSL hydrolase family protein [Deltaproteobacteria bacterium]
MLSLAGLAIAVVGIELYLRSRVPPSFAVSEATIGYVLAPQHAQTIPVVEHTNGDVVRRTNNLGLRRDSDTAVDKPPGTCRILLLGDSQTEGVVNNAETYAARLEQGERERGAANVEILNAAVSGYSPLLEYLWLRERGLRLRPDAIIVALYTGNDVAELLMRHEDFGGLGPRFAIPFLVRDGGEWHVEPPGADLGLAGGVDWWLQTRLRAYVLARRAVLGPAREVRDATARVAAECAGCLQTMWQAAMADGDPKRLDDGFAKLDYLLGQFHAIAVGLRIPLLVAVIPTKIEVEGATVAQYVEHAATILGLHYDAAAFDDAVRERMLALAAQNGLQTVDLLPALRAAADAHGRAQYWSVDWHLNPEGHQVIAEQLAPSIASLCAARLR